jgi:N-acyl-D-aspartate/D-glutamate deacylase
LLRGKGAAFKHRLKTSGSSVNIGSFVGSLTVRRYVLGDTNREATPEEMEKMAGLVREAMQEGALGVASSLLGSPLTTLELIAMAKAAGEYGGIYSTHIRDEGGKIFESLDEAFLIGREARVRIAEVSQALFAKAAKKGRTVKRR